MPAAFHRYSARPLPAARYLPGRTPRPSEPAVPPTPLDPACWWQCEDFLYGVDLFNGGFLWEAHEAWEAPWREAGRHTEVGHLLQGLILLAAAALKHELGEQDVAQRLAARGATKLSAAAAAHPVLDPVGLAHSVVAWISGEVTGPPPLRLDPAWARPRTTIR